MPMLFFTLFAGWGVLGHTGAFTPRAVLLILLVAAVKFAALLAVQFAWSYFEADPAEDALGAEEAQTAA